MSGTNTSSPAGATTMHDGIPVRYWRFRNLVSVGQFAVVALLLTGATVWALSDGNGAQLWDDYFQFANTISDFAHNSWRLPWE